MFQDIRCIFRSPKYASLRAVMRAAVLKGTDLEENPGIIPLIREEGNMSRLAESLNEAMAQKKQEGLSQGRSEGLSQGRSEGLSQGLSEGLSQGLSEGLSQGLSEGLSQGLSQGRSEGSIQTLSEFAEHRFGPDVAGALRAHLARVGDPDEIRRTGLALLDCGSGAEVLARLRSNGHDPAADRP